MHVRLDKLLANMGYGSRKEMKKALKEGHARINGVIVKDGKLHVDPDKDQIEWMGEPVIYTPYRYVMLNKPGGVISATQDARQRTVLDLLDPAYRHFDLFPVGRLDKDTEGLLLLTNDGTLAHQLLSPKHHVPKTYYAEVEGNVTEADQTAFQQGVKLDDGYLTLPAQLQIEQRGSVSKVLITIVEGKFHQVKRMFMARGKRVLYLKRIRFGSLNLDSLLGLGEYRDLSETEVEGLRSLT
jgi:16S rRNA pseudouridine516 synthase